MFTHPKAIRGPGTGSWVSIVTHGSLLALLLLGGRHAWKMHPVAIRGGAHATVLYWGNASGLGLAAQTRVKGMDQSTPVKRVVSKNPAKPLPSKAPNQPAAHPIPKTNATGESATSQQLTTGAGTGSEDATPAFPVYSPSPQIANRSLLPKANENVVVDVNVSAQGEVLDEKLIHGLGNNLDQLILDTVKGWKFHPATVDGNAVASVAELVFPLSQKWQG